MAFPLRQFTDKPTKVSAHANPMQKFQQLCNCFTYLRPNVKRRVCSWHSFGRAVSSTDYLKRIMAAAREYSGDVKFELEALVARNHHGSNLMMFAE